MDQYELLNTNVRGVCEQKAWGSDEYSVRSFNGLSTKNKWAVSNRIFRNQACIQLKGHAVSLSLPSNGASLLAQAVQNRRALLEREKNEREKKRDKKNTNPPEERDIGEGDERESEVPEDIEEGDATQEQQSNYFGSSSTSWNKFQLFYSVLSDEKRKDALTTAHNIRILLTDLLRKGDIQLGTFKILVSIVDGCAVQYRSGSVCYQLCAIAFGLKIVIDRIVHPPGHGKCIVDALNGVDKTLLDLFFSCLVAHPEELEQGMKKVATHVKVEGGEDVSLASVCLDILNDHSHIHGAKSHSNKSRKRVIDEKRYFKREVDEAPGSGAKFKAVGFRENEAKCSLLFMYNLWADPQLILLYSGKMVIAI